MEIFSTLLNIPITQLFALGLIVIFLQRMGIDVMGLIKSLFRLNGKDGTKIIENKLNEIEDNHIVHLQITLDRLLTMQEAENITLALINKGVEDIKEKLKSQR